jgi:hypothetical protein
MKLSAALTIANTAIRTDEYAQAQIEQALIEVVTAMMDATRCTLTTGTVTATAHDAELDISGVDGLRGEEVVRVEVGYHDRGTWSTSLAAVAKNDLVKGDGTPDSWLYVCTAAHTAAADKEPPNTAYWQQVINKRGTLVDVRDYDHLADPERARNPVTGALSCGSPARPRIIAFFDAATAYLSPTPDEAYPIVFQYLAPLVSWDVGVDDPDDVELNIPDKYLYPCIRHGVPAILEAPDPADRAANMNWRIFEQKKLQLASHAVLNRITQRKPRYRI